MLRKTSAMIINIHAPDNRYFTLDLLPLDLLPVRLTAFWFRDKAYCFAVKVRVREVLGERPYSVNDCPHRLASDAGDRREPGGLATFLDGQARAGSAIQTALRLDTWGERPFIRHKLG